MKASEARKLTKKSAPAVIKQQKIEDAERVRKEKEKEMEAKKKADKKFKDRYNQILTWIENSCKAAQRFVMIPLDEEGDDKDRIVAQLKKDGYQVKFETRTYGANSYDTDDNVTSSWDEYVQYYRIEW